MPRQPGSTNDGIQLYRRGTTYYVRGQIRDIKLNRSTRTSDPRLAEELRATAEAGLWRQILDKEREKSGLSPAKPEVRSEKTFDDALASYLRENPPRPTEARNLGKLLEHFKGTPLPAIKREALLDAYAAILTPAAGNATKLRAVLTPLRAVLRHAAEMDWCAVPLFKTPKVGPSETGFLNPIQARELVNCAADHLKPLFTFLFCTGARSSEALELEWPDVDLRGRRAVLTVKGSRASTTRRRKRHVDLPTACITALSLTKPDDRVGRVFKPHKGCRRTGDAYHNSDRHGGGQFAKGWSGASLRAGLPGRWHVWTPVGGGDEKREFIPNVTPHGARHSWASWHYCVHKDLLLLKQVGDWSSVTLCERYAHLMPSTYRDDALAFWGVSSEAVRSVG